MISMGATADFIDIIQELHVKLEHTPTVQNKERAYDSAIKAFKYAKDNDIKVLLVNTEFKQPSSVVISLDYVGPRWCLGYTTYEQMDTYGERTVTKVPHTIQYSDLYGRVNNRNKSKIKIVFEGENPFWKPSSMEVSDFG